MAKRLDEYEKLLSMTYKEAVDYLLIKYGPSTSDYFSEYSYKRFLQGKIKSMNKKSASSRTEEGLYCHHIDEDKWLNIADLDFIKRYRIPFKSQKKDKLVYSDKIEHAILHVLIAKETSGNYGLPGYQAFLKPDIEWWYIDKIIPNPQWMKNCYHKSYLTAEQAICIVKQMQSALGFDYFDSLEEYLEHKNRLIRQKENGIQKLRKKQKGYEEYEKIYIEKEKRRKEKAYNKRTEDFYLNYPKFKNLKITFDSPRKKVLKNLLKYEDKEKTLDEFNKEMLSTPKEDLLKELYSYLK